MILKDTMNGKSIAFVTKGQLSALLVDCLVLKAYGSRGENICVYHPSEHEIGTDYEINPDGTRKHTVSVSITVDNLQTHGAAIFQQWTEDQYVMTVRYYLNPSLSE